MRVDHVLSEMLQVSRSQAQKLIKSGKVSINGAPLKAKNIVSQHQEIVIIDQVSSDPPAVNPSFLEIDIVFEDEHLLVINKPAGLVVHPGAGTSAPTLIDGILYYLHKSPDQLPGDPARPGIVHRLDKDTSGVMVVAKDTWTHNHLAQQFKDKTNLREYFAILKGRMAEDIIEYESYLYRDPRFRTKYKDMSLEGYQKQASLGQSSANIRYAKSTFYKKKTYGGHISLAQVRLHTGRTHQIRVHAKALKLPIVGDQLYGDCGHWGLSLPVAVRKKLASVKRQMLHARLLGFAHPKTEERLGFEVPFPKDIKEIIDCLETYLK